MYTHDLGELRTVYASQQGGIGTLKPKILQVPKLPKPQVKGTKTTRHLAATGVGDGRFGLLLVLAAAIAAAYVRKVRRTA